ncbi:MAG: FliI/YscN family ATPase [Pirellulaceae bacterium]
MLKLNVEQLENVIDRCSDFQIGGTLHSAQGAITASIPASIGQLVKIRLKDGSSCLAEVIGFRGKEAQLMPFQAESRLQQGNEVILLDKSMQVPAGYGMLGRVVNCLGEPIDSQGLVRDIRMVDFRVTPPSPMERRPITEIFHTGQKAIDGVLTMGVGQRVGLMAGSGVGKSTLLGDIAKFAEADLNVVALIGERGREVKPFIEESLGAEGLKRSVVVVSLADETPLARIRAGESAVAIANWFRNQGKKVLLMFDSLTRWAMAQRELGLMLGEPPTSRGYTPSVFQKQAVLLENLGNSDTGSMTALLTVLVEGDDTNDPVADAARSILDGHIFLSRELANAAHFPAIDIRSSASRLFMELTDRDHRRAALALRQIQTAYYDVQEMLQVGAYVKGSLPQTDLAIELFPRIQKFLQQEIGSPVGLEECRQGLMQAVDRWLRFQGN